jgi:hypothetical protein
VSRGRRYFERNLITGREEFADSFFDEIFTALVDAAETGGCW